MQAHQNTVVLNEADLPLYCPKDDAHPRIYIAIKPGETVTCPYCGTEYHLPASSKGSRGTSP